jgi:acyl-CoA synthetase (AMP-forming)/AMP-acid ligase II
MSYCYRHGVGIEKGLTFGQSLENSAQRYPENVAIWYGDVKLTYRQFNEAVNRMANSLLRIGLKRGDRAGILFPDWPEYSIALYACARIGVVITPMNPLFRSVEITTILNHLEAKVFFIPSEWREFPFVELLEQIRSELPTVEHVIVKGGTKASSMLNYDDMVNREYVKQSQEDYLSDYLAKYPVEADDLLEIAYTSGTTGDPKGAVQSHDTRMLNSVGIAIRMGASPGDIWLCMTPLFHATGNAVVQYTTFLTGGTLVLMGRYSVDVSIKEIERTKATVAIGVPTMFIDLMNHPAFNKTDVSSLRYVLFTGAPMPREIALQIVKRFGCGILQADGTTECGTGIFSPADAPVEVTAESPGPPIDVGIEMKIIDPNTGRIVPVNVLGEICIRGSTNMFGYYKNKAKTDEAIDKAGWFHYGDLGTMDEWGNIRLKGRIKDIIIRGGENIYATDMEGIIYKYPKIKEVQVVGAPDKRLGEKTVACIIPKDAADVITRDELVEFMKDKTVKYLIPDIIMMTDSFPRTTSGKVQKHKLREMVARMQSDTVKRS